MSTMATSGFRASTMRSSASASPQRPATSNPGVLEQPGEAFAQQRLVVGDHDSHGISRRSSAPSTADRSADGADAVLICVIASSSAVPAPITSRRRPFSATASTVTSRSARRRDSTVAK